MQDKITICVDGKNLLKPISGIARYLNESLNTMVSEDVKIKLICPGEPLKDYSFHQDIDIIIDKKTSSLGPLRWHGQRLSQIVNTLGCDVFWGPAHRIPFGLNRSIKSVVTCHDLVCIKHSNTMPLKNYISDRIQLPLSMVRADAIHAISQTTSRDVRAYFPKVSSKVFSTLPHQLNSTEKNHKLKIPGKDEWGNYALFVGTFEPRKNIENLINAFQLVCQRYHGMSMLKLKLMGGAGWGGINASEMVAARNLQNFVDIILNPTDTELLDAYKNCRFVILPSLYEGLGLPVIEAKSLSKPTIISNGSLEEIADDDSIVINPYDVNSIAIALEQLFLFDKQYRRHLRNAIKSPAKFTWESNSKNLLVAFRKLISRQDA